MAFVCSAGEEAMPADLELALEVSLTGDERLIGIGLTTARLSLEMILWI
jgi:hypothetical protein